jgi:hypothetical protein
MQPARGKKQSLAGVCALSVLNAGLDSDIRCSAVLPSDLRQR